MEYEEGRMTAIMTTIPTLEEQDLESQGAERVNSRSLSISDDRIAST